jgi:hypothetical protein
MPDKLVARVDLRSPDASQHLRGLDRESVTSGAIRAWATREKESLSAEVAAREERARGEPARRDEADGAAGFDDRLAADSAAVDAARQLAEWASSHGWVTRTVRNTSRLFVPPQRLRDETALRIHFESFGHEPALEFDLAVLRAAGHPQAADAFHDALTRLAGRRLAMQFPSLRCDVVVSKWDEVRENVFEPYHAARVTLAG